MSQAVDDVGHRGDGPALIMPGGGRVWLRDEKVHRDGGPALENMGSADMLLFYREFAFDIVSRGLYDDLHAAYVAWDGSDEDYIDIRDAWFRDGKLHRDDGPAVDDADGSREWYRNGKRHRDDGPALEYAGRREWCRDGELHRDDGPAVEHPDGACEWWIDGKQLPSGRRVKRARKQ